MGCPAESADDSIFAHRPREHGRVVPADDEQDAQRGLVVKMVSQLVVDELDVEVELAPPADGPGGPLRSSSVCHFEIWSRLEHPSP